MLLKTSLWDVELCLSVMDGSWQQLQLSFFLNCVLLLFASAYTKSIKEHQLLRERILISRYPLMSSDISSWLSLITLHIRGLKLLLIVSAMSVVKVKVDQRVQSRCDWDVTPVLQDLLCHLLGLLSPPLLCSQGRLIMGWILLSLLI